MSLYGSLNGPWSYATSSTTAYYPQQIMTVSVPSAGHVPQYTAPALAEDELGWLKRRVTEVTDLCPA